MIAPAGAMPPRTSAVLAAVHHIHTAEGRVTVRAVARRLGVSTGTVFYELRTLRDAGLVDWVDGLKGMLRPTFTVMTVVAAPPRVPGRRRRWWNRIGLDRGQA